ncbi:DnaJ-domain-containing protein [Schizopora paradoxa]|uniref:DnaJ-domain-containing protein n=1 Tax=Schizopora paradoxa TaxID=27342 RepID=A0A0H2RTU9_9AGAM|nr:DnaJ-domain-containing protein [Schizopora paradoxa]
MRLLPLLTVLVCIFATALAWTKEDHEIFDLVSALEAAEGKGTTFYSWLDVSPTASASDIGRAYRKKSVQLHPDKNQGVKGAHERFARLGVIAQILRNSEGRERYDFFYKNGVPTWRGTGYYYSRYRPGLGSAVVFLVILTSGLQFGVQAYTYKSELARIDRFMNEARAAARGPKMNVIEGKRKVKVNMGGRAFVDEDGNVVNGRSLDMVVEGQNVYIVEANGELLPLDYSAATPPAVGRTWFISTLSSIYGKMKSKVTGVSGEKDADEFKESDVDGDGTEDTTSMDESVSNGANGSASTSARGGPAAIAGGRRRKAVKPKKKKNAKDAS